MGVCARELGWIKNAEIWQKFFWKISRKSFVYAEYRDCKFVRYMREITFVVEKCRNSKKISLKNPYKILKIRVANSCAI